MVEILREKPSRRRPLDEPKAEFADYRGVYQLYGIKQSFLYQLWSTRKIRSVLIPGRGKTRGKRLYDCESIRQYLAKVAKEEVSA
jgi:hypothetical protein